jgi:4-hydroxy-tetrahydrodipicolinate synthase
MTRHDTQIMAASLTPLNADRSVNHQGLAAHVRWLLCNGCDGVALFGTTGEANSFSVEQRQLALEFLIQAGIPPQRLLVGTGCCAFSDTLALTRHALEQGVQRVLVLPPFYYKTASQQGLYETFASLIEQVADPSLRVYLYHFPKMAVVDFTPELIARLAEVFPEQIAGVKDSSGDREHTFMLKARFPGLKIYPGSEMFLLDYLRSGGDGCISATTNLTAALAAAVRDGINEPGVEGLFQRLTAVRSVMERHPMIGALKGLLALHTGRDQWRNVSLPLSCISRDQAQQLRTALSELGYEIPYE